MFVAEYTFSLQPKCPIYICDFAHTDRCPHEVVMDLGWPVRVRPHEGGAALSRALAVGPDTRDLRAPELQVITHSVTK